MGYEREETCLDSPAIRDAQLEQSNRPVDLCDFAKYNLVDGVSSPLFRCALFV